MSKISVLSIKRKGTKGTWGGRRPGSGRKKKIFTEEEQREKQREWTRKSRQKKMEGKPDSDREFSFYEELIITNIAYSTEFENSSSLSPLSSPITSSDSELPDLTDDDNEVVMALGCMRAGVPVPVSTVY
jgi:hypothetical protein